jgi:hypothetical protein
MPTPQHVNQSKFWRSKLKETAYGTSPSTGTPANYKQVIPRSRALADVQPNVQDNAGYATGYARPTEQWLVNHDVSFSHDVDLCAEEIGRDLLDAFGKVVTTQPDAIGNAGVYSHVFSTMDLTASRQLPSRSWVEQQGSAIDRIFAGVVLAQLAMMGEGSQRLGASGQWHGSGKVVTPSGLTGADITGLHYFYQSQVTVKFDNGGTITNMATAPNRLNSWRVEIINQLLADDGFRPGAAAFQTAGNADSGEVRTEMLLGDQSFNIVANVRMLSNDPLLAYLLAQTSLVFTADIVGAVIAGGDGTLNYKLAIKAYKAPFKAVKIGEHNGLTSLELTINPLYDLTSGKDLEITLTNGVASYTV